MSKNPFHLLPKLQTPPMAPSHPHIISAVANALSIEDDEDNDICPVCDGECTCDNNNQRVHPPASIAHTQHVITTLHSPFTTPVQSAKPKLPPLKIKLTVPPNLLGKKRGPTANSNRPLKTTTHTTGDQFCNPTTSGKALVPNFHRIHPHPIPKRRGRPPKGAAPARDLAVRVAADRNAILTRQPPLSQSRTIRRKATLPAKQKTRSSISTRATTFKGRGTTVQRGSTKRKRVTSSEDGESSSELSDIDPPSDLGDDEDARSEQFPTFISASALSSLSSVDSDSGSSSSSSSSSGFDTDSSIEAEEENYIVTEESRGHEKARVRRELLGDDTQRKRDLHNDWVIRPRKKSVDPSDVEMAGESDATEEEADQEEEEECDDDEETDGRSTGAGYVGLATGWSDDEESSFDADLFFANLSDSHDSSSSQSGDEGGADGDHSDLDAMSSEAAGSGFLPPRVDNLPFEVTEGWDGQIVFTNGIHEGQGVIDIDFEVNAAQFVIEKSPSPNHESDVEMSTTTEIDDGGYEQDEDGGEGDTTDEELVGEDDLPNERAMRLFNLPFSVSAINPMSTMSPTVSPSPRDRKQFSHLDSPNPSDILSGKIFWDSDGPMDAQDNVRKGHRRLSSSCDGVPRAGVFETTQAVRQVIIDDSHKNIPSPHPRFPGRGRSISRPGRSNTVENLLRRHLQSAKLSSESSPIRPSLQLMSPSDIGTTSPEMPPAEPIDLDDVLEASFLGPDPFDMQVTSNTSSPKETDSHKQLNNLSRWDLISVGAFRQTRESGAITDNAPEWNSDAPGPTPTDYGNMMKSSPLSPMLWQNKSAGNGKKSKRPRQVATSPVLLPIREQRDGDRTPTNTPPHPPPPKNQNQNHPHKTRKELRRERKLKRKSYGPPHQNYQHHRHQHHPNSKSRSTASAQRNNFNSPSSLPPLNI